MGARYSVRRSNAALSTTNDHMTIIVPATRALKIWSVRAGGLGTTSTANEIRISRSTAGATGGGAITPTPLSTLSPASGVTVNTTWTTQPTIGATLLSLPVNGNGAINPWTALPGMEVEVPPGGQISIRSLVGTANASVEVIFEEVG